MPWYEIKMAGKKKAEIQIYDLIGKDFYGDGQAVEAKKFINDLKALGDIDHIDLRINSPGGAVFEGNAIYNALKNHKAEITVYIDGLAASMASVIAMVGNKIIMPKNAMMMIHNPLSCVCGNAIELRKTAEMLDKIKEGAVSAYQEKSGQSREKISELMDEESWMTSDECLEMGFADSISDEMQIAASFDLQIFKNAPALPVGLSEMEKTPPVEEPKASESETVTPTELVSEKNKGEKTKMDKETLMKEHLAVYNDIKSEGAKEERQRIKAIEELAIKGHEEIINEVKFDGKTTPGEVAMKVIAAQKQQASNHLQNLTNDAPKPVAQPTVSAVAEEAKPQAEPENLTEEQKIKAEWEKDPKLQKEMDQEAYVLFRKAEIENRV